MKLFSQIMCIVCAVLLLINALAVKTWADFLFTLAALACGFAGARLFPEE